VVEIRNICVTGENNRSEASSPTAGGLGGAYWLIFETFRSHLGDIMTLIVIDPYLILYRKLSPVISPKYHIQLTGDFDFSTGFHRSPAVISTADQAIIFYTRISITLFVLLFDIVLDIY